MKAAPAVLDSAQTRGERPKGRFFLCGRAAPYTAPLCKGIWPPCRLRDCHPKTAGERGFPAEGEAPLRGAGDLRPRAAGREIPPSGRKDGRPHHLFSAAAPPKREWGAGSTSPWGRNVCALWAQRKARAALRQKSSAPPAQTKKAPFRCVQLRKHSKAREKRYSFGYAVSFIFACYQILWTFPKSRYLCSRYLPLVCG